MKHLKHKMLGLLGILVLMGSLVGWQGGFGKVDMIQPVAELAIGADLPLPAQKMMATDGRLLSVADIKGTKGTAVVFWCNTCPWVARYEDRMIALATDYKAKGFGFIAINANDPVAYPEEGMEQMKQKAMGKKYPFPYVFDKGSTIAKAYGAARTPHVFVFNAAQKLVYVGGVDDNPQDATGVKTAYLKNALEALLNNKPIAETQTRAFGCTIKWQNEN